MGQIRILWFWILEERKRRVSQKMMLVKLVKPAEPVEPVEPQKLRFWGENLRIFGTGSDKNKVFISEIESISEPDKFASQI